MPLITGGCWNAMPIPSFTRSAVERPMIPSPLYIILPPVTWYFEKPSMPSRRDVFPDPLGPRSTWDSPYFIVRLRYLSTGLPSTSKFNDFISSTSQLYVLFTEIPVLAVITFA